MSKAGNRNPLGFCQNASTKICQEVPCDDNPYVTQTQRLHGYDLLQLVQKRSFIEVLFLLFKGELPSKNALQILEALMVGCINPGPRHPATRAAMSAGVGKTRHEHILPIGLMVLGGARAGSSEVENVMKFFKSLKITRSGEIEYSTSNIQEDVANCSTPGFGQRYGGIDIQTQELADYLVTLPGAGTYLKWGDSYSRSNHSLQQGWLISGLASAVFVDLGFGAREGAGLFQLMSSPGLLAHGLEQTHKPINSMPLLSDEDYVMEK